jgi:hypothetical protein
VDVGGIKLERAWFCALSLAAGCHGPNPDYLGVSESGSSTGSGSTSTTMSTSSSGTDSSTTSATTDPTETATDSTDDPTETTGDLPDPTCGDGNSDPGEFCFSNADVSDLVEVESLAAGDFDGDGKLDLAIGRKDDVLVLFGDGLGGFPLESDLPEPPGNYRGVAAGDLDGDQLDDLGAVNQDADDLLVYLSTGNGSFAPAITHPLGDSPTQLYLIHLDEDPFLDAITAVRNTDRVAISFGDGVGGFTAPVTFDSGGDEPVALGLGFFDPGDLIDVVVANSNSDEVGVLLGNGLGQLADPAVHQLAGRPRAAVIADFNLDSYVDVAAPLEDVDRVALLLGQGDGSLFEPVIELDVGNKPMGAAATDLDNDSASDLLVLNVDDASVGVLFNNPDAPGQFTAHQTLVWFDDFYALAAILVADFNDDGVDDVIVGGSGVRAMLSDP